MRFACRLCRGSRRLVWSVLTAPGRRSNKPIPSAGVRRVLLIQTPPSRVSGTRHQGGNFLKEKLAKRKHTLPEHSSGTWTPTPPKSTLLCFGDFRATSTCEFILCAFPSSLLIDCVCKTTVLRESLLPWGRDQKLCHSYSNSSG